MALTEDQKSRCRMYLGYERNRDIYPHLESKFDLFTATEEALVVEILTELASLRTVQSASVTAAQDGISSVRGASSQVDFQGGTVLLESQMERGRYLVSRLESMFGVARRMEFFGPGGTTGGAILLG